MITQISMVFEVLNKQAGKITSIKDFAYACSLGTSKYTNGHHFKSRLSSHHGRPCTCLYMKRLDHQPLFFLES